MDRPFCVAEWPRNLASKPSEIRIGNYESPLPANPRGSPSDKTAAFQFSQRPGAILNQSINQFNQLIMIFNSSFGAALPLLATISSVLHSRYFLLNLVHSSAFFPYLVGLRSWPGGSSRREGRGGLAWGRRGREQCTNGQY